MGFAACVVLSQKKLFMANISKSEKSTVVYDSRFTIHRVFPK